MNDTVTDYDTTGTSDAAVDGRLHASHRVIPNTHCIYVDAGNGCTFYVGGSTAVAFDERPATVSGGSVYYQDLTVTGSGLQIKGPVSFNCYGIIANNNAISLNAKFGLRATSPGVNFNRIDFSDHTT